MEFVGGRCVCGCMYLACSFVYLYNLSSSQWHFIRPTVAGANRRARNVAT